MMMSSVARVKFIKTKVIFRYHTKGVSNQVSSNSDYQIKSCSCSDSSTKIEKKRKSGKKILWITKHTNKRITNWDRSKSRQEGLQKGAALGISILGKKITNRGRDFKSGKRDFKSGQRLEIVARGISNRGRDYKSVQNSGRQ